MPVTIKVIPPATVLLVTGPNTGGKTVALKTAGLLAMMAQAGLRIPAADGSRLPVFRSLFADIGDEQSIEASLSTFSAHITNIASMDRGLATPALVLLDEVGSGTDPIEGGALGVAIVDHFRRRGATVIATSHYDALKTYASTTEGVASAAFGFDADDVRADLSADLRHRRAAASRSRSPARLGLNPSVVAAARENLSAREAQLAEHLAKIDRDMRALEHEHRLAARERETLEAGRGAHASARRRAAPARRDVPQAAERGARHPGAPGAQGNRRRDRGAEGEGRGDRARRRAWCRPATPARRAATRAPRSTQSPSGSSPARAPMLCSHPIQAAHRHLRAAISRPATG